MVKAGGRESTQSLPEGWDVQLDGVGRTVVRPARRVLPGPVGSLLGTSEAAAVGVLSLLWLLPVLIAAGFRLSPPGSALGGSPSFWAGVIAGVPALGVWLLGRLARRCQAVEWHLEEDTLEVRARVLLWSRTRRYQGAVLRLTTVVEGRATIGWCLEVREAQRSERLVGYEFCSRPELAAVRRCLAVTGWLIEERTL